MQYDYPGNVRELENIIEHSVVMCQDIEIQLKHLPPELQVKNISISEQNSDNSLPPFQEAERKLIRDVLEKNKGSKVKAAEELKLHRATLYRKMKRYGLL